VSEIPPVRPPVRLGLLLPNPLAGRATSQHADHGVGREAEGDLAGAVTLAATAERAGFDSLWVSDSIPTEEAKDAEEAGTHRDGLPYEAYSLLGALAVSTRSLSLGALPRHVDPRAPSVLAKIVTTIDVLSDGRSIITLGTGPSPGRMDVERLAEAIMVCRAVLKDADPEFTGSFYEIHGAVNRPPPVRSGGIPVAVLVNGEGPSWSEALEVAARSADAVVVGGDEAAIDRAVGTVGRIAQSEDHSRPPVPVIWTGPLSSDQQQPPSERPRDLMDAVRQIGARIDAGAEGCIISIDGIDQIGTILESGPMLLDKLDHQ
jgi:alkanesulfonate monooxygenase SsuD/methylene tetrahydromethanopterin reductase-like flavin-dependent oxidoreductase (luciferase family)